MPKDVSVQRGGGMRSLKAALSDAGFGEGPTLPRREVRPGVDRTEAAAGSATSRLVFDQSTEASRALPQSDADTSLPSRPAKSTSSVVSPPPWLRAAQRGRRRARVANTFGWLMTIFVAGSIIGLAGRYLAVPPGMEHAHTARQ